jgi:hypothetical protein
LVAALLLVVVHRFFFLQLKILAEVFQHSLSGVAF